MFSVVFPRCHAFPPKDQRQGSNRPEEGDAKERIKAPKNDAKDILIRKKKKQCQSWDLENTSCDIDNTDGTLTTPIPGLLDKGADTRGTRDPPGGSSRQAAEAEGDLALAELRAATQETAGGA